ncbi:MAG: PAS domain S-box protein, partial [Bacteroidota bacterium]
MQKEQIHLLLVDDDEDDYIITRDLLTEIETTDFTIEWVENYEDAVQELTEDRFDVYLIDYRLGEHRGFDLLKKGIELGVRSPIIVLTGKGFAKVDFQAMQMGAADYLVKDGLNALVIERSIRYAINNAKIVNKLHTQKQKYRTLFEQSVNAIYITNQENLFIDANSATEQLFGYSLAELRNMSLKNLFSQPEQYPELYQKLTRKGMVKDFEAILLHQDGRPIACSLSAARLVDTGGALQGYQWIITDVSQKKKVQQ